ncbi:MAG: BrnT family toxin [Anaerolineae bacterium]
MEFEWDPQKVARNFRKHKVSFTEAATVFDDPLSGSFLVKRVSALPTDIMAQINDGLRLVLAL